MIKKSIFTLFCLLSVAACKIENDIPYPVIEGNIIAMEVEGQRASSMGGTPQAVINKTNYTVQLYVNDSVQLFRAPALRRLPSDLSRPQPERAGKPGYQERLSQIGRAHV